jgi:acyl carrier protein
MDELRADVRRAVLEATQRVAETDDVDETTNYFEAGGDSLGLIELCADLEASFRTELPLELVWEAGTLADLIEMVVTRVRAQQRDS